MNMTPISSAASAYGRVASGTVSPVDRSSAAQPVQPWQAPDSPQASDVASSAAQRPSTVVTISPQARERAEAAEREERDAASGQGQVVANDAPGAQAASGAAETQAANPPATPSTAVAVAPNPGGDDQPIY